MDIFQSGGAEFSACGRYRYLLWRQWYDTTPPLVFVMLNPSTADAEHDDPTVAGCAKRARAWGYGGLRVLNLFQLRSTDPRALYSADDPVGPTANETILRACRDAGDIIAAWGNHGLLRGRHHPRWAEVVDLIVGHLGRDLMALKLNKSGQPCHPLYLPHALQPFVWMTRKKLDATAVTFSLLRMSRVVGGNRLP